METSVKQRIVEYIKYKGLSHKRFETAAGLSNGYLNSLRHSPSPMKLQSIVEAFPDLNRDWLLTGNGYMLNDDSDAKVVGKFISDDLVNVPYVPTNAAASFVENLYGIEYDMEEYGVSQENMETLSDGTYVVFGVERDSMAPTIMPGAKILCRIIDEGKWEYASGIVVIVYGKTLTVKRIVDNRLFQDNILILKGDNPKVESKNIQRSEIRGMWKAIRIVSQKLI